MRTLRPIVLSFALLFAGLVSAQSILEVAANDPGLSTFVSVIEQSGLDEVLQTGGPYTLFAPTNAAFEQIPSDELSALLAQPEVLRRVLSYHVVPAFVMARDAVQATVAPTLSGEEIRIRVENGNLLINESRVVKFDVGATQNVQASNGVIHVVDSLLLPAGVMLSQSSTQEAANVRDIQMDYDRDQNAPYLTGALSSVRYPIIPVNGTNVRGSVLIVDYGLTNAVITVSLRGTSLNDLHPAHFHAGNCGSNGDITVPLTSINGASGLSVTTGTSDYTLVTSSNQYINIHLSADAISTIIACGETGVLSN